MPKKSLWVGMKRSVYDFKISLAIAHIKINCRMVEMIFYFELINIVSGNSPTEDSIGIYNYRSPGKA